MTAQIVGFVTRAQAGLRPPRSISRSITPQNGGGVGHWGGPAQPAAEPGSDHARCVETWWGWQNYHMDKHRWVDVAYTGGYCNHGYAFAGRGMGVRTAANGTNYGNQNYYAYTWIGGAGQMMTVEAVDALEWWFAQGRAHGAGRHARPHLFFKPTGCPGDVISEHCDRLNGRDVPAPAPAPAPVNAREERVKELQRIAGGLQVDGDDGELTYRRLSQLMVGWEDEIKRKRRGRYLRMPGNYHAKNLPNGGSRLVQWLQQQGNRRFNFGMAEDGYTGPATNHLIVVGLGQSDSICGPNGYRNALG